MTMKSLTRFGAAALLCAKLVFSQQFQPLPPTITVPAASGSVVQTIQVATSPTVGQTCGVSNINYQNFVTGQTYGCVGTPGQMVITLLGGGGSSSGTATSFGVLANTVKAQTATLANQVFVYVPANSDFELVSLPPLIAGQGTAVNANGTNKEIDVVRNIRVVSGTTDTPTVADCGNQIAYTSTSAVTVGLPTANSPAGTFQEGCEIKFIAQGTSGTSGGLTINGGASTIYNYNGTTGGTATQTTVTALTDISLNSHSGNWWNVKQPSSGGGAVSSVFARTGTVVAASGDYTLDQIGNPAAAKSWSMGSNFLTFTFGAATGSSNALSITDTASNTGTGFLLFVENASGSGMAPFKLCANGAACFAMDVNGNLTDSGGSQTFTALSANFVQPYILRSQGGTATIAPNTTGAGSGGTLVCASGHACSSVSGELTLTTGTSPATGTLGTVTYQTTQAYSSDPNCTVFSHDGKIPMANIAVNDSSLTVLTLTIQNAALSASTTYTLAYSCSQGN